GRRLLSGRDGVGLGDNLTGRVDEMDEDLVTAGDLLRRLPVERQVEVVFRAVGTRQVVASQGDLLAQRGFERSADSRQAVDARADADFNGSEGRGRAEWRPGWIEQCQGEAVRTAFLVRPRSQL